MGWKIIFAPQSLEELEQIVRFIAQDDPRAAILFGDHLVDRAESLANFPELGTPYRKRANVRRLLCKSYFIYYRVRREQQL
jgi:toxin ParE1/3/4